MKPAAFRAWPIGFLILALVSSRVEGQIAFRQNPDTAIAEAQRMDRPLMFVIVDRRRSGSDRWERRVSQALADRDVIAASQLFVPVRLQAEHLPQQAANWGLNPERAEGAVVFTTPDGRRVHGSSAASAERLTRDILSGYENFCEYIWDYEISDVLSDPAAPDARRIIALERVARHGIRPAEPGLIELLESRPNEAVRAALSGALAAISTPRAVESLIREVGRGDATAVHALRRCTPIGAEAMLGWLDDPNEQVRSAVYDAVVAICNIRSPKPARFWETAPEARRLEEIRRVRSAVRQSAMEHRLASPWDR